MEPRTREHDPVLRSLIADAASDPVSMGLILTGSRGAGCPGPESDYDLEWVLTDAAFQEQMARVPPLDRKKKEIEGQVADICYSCPAKLARDLANPGWWTYAYVSSRVLLDKTGEVTTALQAIALMPEEKARADASGWYDAYMNDFYRSLKAWRRGDELGGRRQAAESALHLVRVLFALEQRWTPYHDRLGPQLETLASQGWPTSYLREALLGLVSTGDPTLQQQLEARVAALMRERGYAHVVDAWGGEIERVRAFRFG
jgi:hypothetical protein